MSILREREAFLQQPQRHVELVRCATNGLRTGQRTFAAQLNKLRPNLDSITPELEPVPIVVLYMFTVLGIPESALRSNDK